MSLQSFRLHGVEIEQKRVAITDKQTHTLVSVTAGQKAKVLRLVVAAKQECKFVIQTGSEGVRDVFIGSDAHPFIEEGQDFRWPIFVGNDSSDVTIYQSDLTTCDASAYVQYRAE